MDRVDHSRTSHYLSRAATASAKWWPLVVWALMVALVSAWLVVTLIRERDTQLGLATARVQTMAALAAEHALRVVEGADTALKAIRPMAQAVTDWSRFAADREVWQHLRAISESLSAMPTMFIVDPDGMIRQHGVTFPLPPIDISQRDYFQRQRRAITDAALLSDPIVGMVIKRDTLILSRRVSRADGGFAGLVCANITPDIFREVFSTLAAEDGAIINLQRGDGTILVRHPRLSGAEGRVVDNAEAFPAITAGLHGAEEVTRSPLDGISRITAFRRLERYDLVVLAAQPVESVMAPWRRQVLRLGLVAGSAIFALTATFVMLLRRYHAEAEARLLLKQSEANLNRAQSVAHIGSWNFSPRSGEVRWSEETYHIFELPLGTAIDMSVVLGRIPPEEREAVIDGLAAAEAGEPLVMEHRLLVDGRTKWVDVRAQATLMRPDGEVELLGTIQDITRRKLVETAMAENQSLLLEVQAVAQLGYYVYDIVNDRWESSQVLDAIFGIGPDYPRDGAGWLDLVAPDMRDEMAIYLGEIQGGVHGFDKEYRIIRHDDGVARWVIGLGKIESSADGRPLRMVGTIKDSTESHAAAQALQEQAAELARSNTELEQFAYVASHDLREPLRMVGSYVGLLERRYGDQLDDDAREFIAFAKEGAGRMDRLVLDLLEYSRIGRVTRPMLPVNLAHAAERAVRALSEKITDAGAEIATPLDILPTVLGDAEELTRLFQNLIGNAVKYRDPERAPVITLTAERQGQTWAITVADNGIGIEPQYFDRIFLIFQRLHHRGEYEGTGIGLAICKKIAEHHGGHITVVSAPGKGTAFTVILPAVG